MLKKIWVICLATLIFSAVFVKNNPFLWAIDSENEEIATVLVGETKIIAVHSPSRVVIGNPKVADVISVSASEIVISGKAPGATTLVFWDAYGEQSIKVRVFTEDMAEIERRVDNLLAQLNVPGVTTTAVNEENKVNLLGVVKTAQDKERIALALGPLKDKTVDLIQIKEDESIVEIDVQVLELNKDATDTLGFTWPGSINFLEVGSPGIAAAGTTWGKIFKLSDVMRGTADGALPFTLKLDALIQEGKARILSRPRLACQSGKEAQLLVGGEKPVFTTTTTEGGNTSSTVDYKEYGIKLKIKPYVEEGGRIKLAVNMEVSEVGTAETIGSSTAPSGRAYPLTKRMASTEVYLDDGQTMAIGGLIKQKTEEDLRKFPWLADMPVLGGFFRQRVTKEGGGQGERGNAELFITLTTTIVKGQDKAAKANAETAVAAVAAPAAPSIPPSAPVKPELAGYVRAVQERIVNAIYYPQQAKQVGWEGNLRLSLNLTANGTLKEIRLVKSSGYRILDDAAMDVAQKQAPYPPFPPQIDSQEIWVDVPIFYKNN